MFRRLMLVVLAAMLSLFFLFGCKETTPVANPIAKIAAVSRTVVGNKILLDARGSSDPGGKALKYSFTVAYLASFAEVEDDPNSPIAYFIPKQQGAYTVQLTVTSLDGRKSSAVRQTITADKLAITNISPTGKNITIPVTMTWTCNGGEDTLYFVHMLVGQTPVLISPETGQKICSLSKAFSNNMTVKYEITAVNNGITEKSDILEFTTAPNTPPAAEAGANQSVYQGSVVHLAGSGSDSNGDPVTLTWKLNSGPEQLDMTNAQGPNFSFTAHLPGKYVFKLQVSDSVSITEDSVEINVQEIKISNCAATTVGTETEKKLSWKCNVPAQYAVFLSTTQAFGTRTAYIDANSYTPQNLCHGTTYYWKIEAHFGESVVESELNTFSIPGASWEQLGLANKTANGIFLDPNAGIIYVGTENGLFGSANGGLEFYEIIPQINVTGICLSDPNNGYISTRGSGILKLRKGIIEEITNVPESVSTVGLDPYDPNVVVAPTLYDGIYISHNGVNFQNAYPSARSSSNSLAFTEEGIFIATNLGLVSSMRGTTSWTLETNSFENHPLWCIASFEDQIICANDLGNAYFYSSPQWSKANFTFSSPATCILYINHNLVYAGKNTGGVDRFNGSWQTYSQGLPNAQVTALATDGIYIYAGCANQGIWRILAR